MNIEARKWNESLNFSSYPDVQRRNDEYDERWKRVRFGPSSNAVTDRMILLTTSPA